MWVDPIVEEVRKVRQEHAARFNHDLDAICRDLQDQEKANGRTYVSLPPRRIDEQLVTEEQATESQVVPVERKETPARTSPAA